MRQNRKTVSPMSNEGRNLYVVKHITDALLKLMRSRCLNGISISQICEEAGVGRASFYRNYESKEDVLRKYLERLIREWEKDFENKGDLAFFSESMLRHFYKYKDFVFKYSGSGDTLSLNAQLSDRAGVFSALTAVLYGCGANIVTVSQGLPENGKANVSLTLSIGSEMSAEELISRLLATDGVISIKRIDGGKK